MTIIKPQSNTFALRYTLAVLVFLVIAAGILLVFLYNRAMNFAAGAEAAVREAKRLETVNAELQNQIFSLFTSARVDALASEYGLVKDKSPRYLELHQRWFLASQY